MKLPNGIENDWGKGTIDKIFREGLSELVTFEWQLNDEKGYSKWRPGRRAS